MESTEQAQLIREFMLRLAPEMAHHRLSLIRRHLASVAYDQPMLESEVITHASQQTAKLCLEWAMHLAGQYAQFHDMLIRGETVKDQTNQRPEGGST